MSQTEPGISQTEAGPRRGTTTMIRQRGRIVVRIEGVPTYQDVESGEVMIPGPLAVKLDDAMLAMLDAIDQAGSDPLSAGSAGA